MIDKPNQSRVVYNDRPSLPNVRCQSTTARERSSLPLDGITVVSLEQAIAAPVSLNQLSNIEQLSEAPVLSELTIIRSSARDS
jgi:hypothetical protein